MHVFQSTLPVSGPGALKSRDDNALRNTDKEKQLLVPQTELYSNLAKECVKNAVCVNNYLFAFMYLDVASLGAISSTTGGDTFFYQQFTPNDLDRILYDLSHVLNRNSGIDAVMRIRCTNGKHFHTLEALLSVCLTIHFVSGLQVMDHYGNFNMTNFTDVELAGIDEDKAIAVSLKHDGKLEDERGVSFQAALLYTTKEGRRRVRVHNLNIPITEHIADVFRQGDHEAMVTFLAKKGKFLDATTCAFLTELMTLGSCALQPCTMSSILQERRSEKSYLNYVSKYYLLIVQIAHHPLHLGSSSFLRHSNYCRFIRPPF